MLPNDVFHFNPCPELHDGLNYNQRSQYYREISLSLLQNGMGWFLHGLHIQHWLPIVFHL